MKQLLTQVTLLNKGYHLYVDNFYTSPVLAEYLFTENTLLTGTLRSNRKGNSSDAEVSQTKSGGVLLCKKGPFAYFVVEGKEVPEESLPYADNWYWCWDGRPHLLQWPGEGIPQGSLFIQPAYGRGGPTGPDG